MASITLTAAQVQTQINELAKLTASKLVADSFTGADLRLLLVDSLQKLDTLLKSDEGETKTSDVVVPPPGDVHHQMFKVAQMAFHKMASQFINCSEGIRSLEYNAEKSTEKKCIYNFEYFWTGGLVLFFSFLFFSFFSFFSFFLSFCLSFFVGYIAPSHTRY